MRAEFLPSPMLSVTQFLKFPLWLIPATEADETLIEEVEGWVLDTTMAMEQEGWGQPKKIKNRLYTQENLRWWDNAH